MRSPALKYYGGKWKIAKDIIPLMPPHKTFVDAMCGAGSITLRKPVSKNEIVNDVHGEVVNFFKVLRDRPHELRQKLKDTPYARGEYYKCREICDDPLEQARRTVVKSWFGIGDSLDNKTGFRVSISQGGPMMGPWLRYTDHLLFYSERMRDVVIENLDYKEIVKRYDREDTLFYFDPPYLKETRSKNHAYKHDWKIEDHEEFCNILKSIKGKFLVSGYNGEPYTSSGYFVHKFTARTQSKSATEYVWANFNPKLTPKKG